MTPTPTQLEAEQADGRDGSGEATVGKTRPRLRPGWRRPLELIRGRRQSLPEALSSIVYRTNVEVCCG